MAKFSNARATGNSPLKTTETPDVTYEGAPAFRFTDETELLLLAATNLVSENSFYEHAAQRDIRYRKLIHQVTRTNPAFIAGDDTRLGLARYLRRNLKIRTASLVMVAEYIKAGGPNGRTLVRDVLSRPDEPAELIGYWLQTYGRVLPQPLKRGIADAIKTLYTPVTALKWDSKRHKIQFADVIELTHPKGGPFFKYLLDARHDRFDDIEQFPLIARTKALEELDAEERRSYVKENGMPQDWTWERFSGWIGEMDAAAWEAAIPGMGVMALIRNLRNFDQARISNEVVNQVIAKITDPQEVAASRIWPLNVMAAYKMSESDNYQRALGLTLDLTTKNMPLLEGSTLVLVDTSGSMATPISARSKLQRCDAAAVMGAAIACKNNARLVAFDTDSTEVPYFGHSVLNIANAINQWSHGGTNTFMAIHRHFKGEDRIIIITDDQTATTYRWDSIRERKPFVHVFDLGGYGKASMEYGSGGQYVYGGFSDSLFSLMPILEMGGTAGWPF